MKLTWADNGLPGRTNDFEPDLMGKGWLKVKKVAQFLDCSKAQVYDLVHGGELTAFQHNQILRISLESLEKFIEFHQIRDTEAPTT